MKSLLLFTSLLVASATPSLAQWTKINAVPSQDIVALALNGDTLLAASGTNQLYRSADGGSTWDTLKFSANPVVTVAMKSIDHTVFVVTTVSGIFSSADGGLTWTNTGMGIPFASVEKNGSELFAATLGNGIYRFDSLSGHWTPFNNALPSYSVNVFDLASTTRSFLVSAGTNGTIYRYDFSLNTWNEEYYYGRLRPGLQIQQLFHAGDTLYAINGNKIIRSDNDGMNWSNDHTGSHNGYSRRFYSGLSTHYTVTNLIGGGTWLQQRNRSASIGSTWANNEELFSTGYTYDILEHQGTLFLAKQNGLYVKKIVLTSMEPFPDLPAVQIAPNPTAAEINISCSERIKKAILFDATGRQVYVVVIGENKFSFSPDLAKGVYVLALELSNGKTVSKKVTID